MLSKTKFLILSFGEYLQQEQCSSGVKVWCRGSWQQGLQGWHCPCRTELHPPGHKWALHQWCINDTSIPALLFSFLYRKGFFCRTCVTPILHDPETPSAEPLSSALCFCQMKEVALGQVEATVQLTSDFTLPITGAMMLFEKHYSTLFHRNSVGPDIYIYI